ncbi:hypothetical protein Pmani_006985 [Petrolisthes manimaculis]|uniref:Uncharacterized protein n=1 Tax=Petrolisthes manimaculis TaxID=1843537 RepID=A0AAE1Q965_9EUCA|nr:hypothetical protein Pmani_006985 [Petrolisthes manimaculis]
MYLDDWLLFSPSKEETAANVSTTTQLLQEMGWLVNWGKSKLIPTQSITWLGIQWSTRDSSLSLAPENARNTLKILRRCAFSSTLSRRQCENLLGSLNFAAPALPLGRLKHRRLSREVNSHFPQHPRDHQTPVPASLSRLLKPWMSLGSLQAPVPWTPPLHTVLVATDASDVGWGLQSQLGHQACGGWSEELRLTHINYRELHVVREWLLKFPTPRGMSIRFDMDNSTAVSCIKRQDVSESSRLDFLRKRLRSKFLEDSVALMLNALRPTSRRQYQSCWKRFQIFLSSAGRPLSQDTVLSFLTWLSSTGNRAPATVTAHVSALADPLWFGADIHLERRALTLLSWGIRATSTPGPRNTPRWSLHKVLASVETLTQSQGEDELLMSSLFLLALATGFRASQLAALTRHSNFTSFGENDDYLTLAPSPIFLAKNERSDRLIAPLRVPALREDHSHLPLCPVHATRAYIEPTKHLAPSHLFYNSRSHKPLRTRTISKLLCRVIEKADPGNCPRAHSIRGMAASLAFLRSRSLTRVQELEGWASIESFLNRYLLHDVQQQECVALGTKPSP